MKRFLPIVLLFAFFLFGIQVFAQPANHVVISEVYGGGGNSGATLKSDFIELYNPTSSPVSLTGWSIQYASATGTGSWLVTPLSGTIAANGYFLIKQADGTGGTVDLPTADVIGTIAMAAGAGKVVLLSTTTAFSGTCPTSSPNFIDFVGYGTTANCSETANAPVPSATLSIERKARNTSSSVSMALGGSEENHGNSEDSNDNSSDFVTRAVPQPQNASSAIEILPLTPAFNNLYPKVQRITTTSFRTVVSLNTKATVYAVIQIDGQPAPTSAQVIAGQDNTGTPVAANFKASQVVNTGSTEVAFTLSGLTPAAIYDVYFVASSVDGTMATPAKVDVTMLNPGDVTPPTFDSGFPSVVAVIDYAFTIRTKINEPGNTFFVVLPDNAIAPSSAQVKAGTDASGATLGAGLFGALENIVAGTDYQDYVTVLTPNTSYDVYVVAEDNIPNLQTSPIKIDVTTTISPFVDDFAGCIGVSSFSQFSVAGDQQWTCTDFGKGSTGVRMNGFASSAVANEDWLISPKLTLQNLPVVSFASQFSFAGNPLKLMISTNYSGVGSPSAATWIDLNASFPTVAVGSTSTSLADWTNTDVDISTYANQQVYIAFVYTSTASAASRWTLDDFKVTNAKASYLNVNTSGLSFKESPTVKSYVLSGFNITDPVTVTAPVNFQVSKDNLTFSNTITFTAIEVSMPKTVYVKFTAPANSAQIFNGTISNLSSGVFARNVSVNGVDINQTFDISAYNLEFFASPLATFGPSDDALQTANVKTVLQTIKSDVFGIVEVSVDAAVDEVLTGLPGYSKIMSPRWSYSFNPPDPTFPDQKIGFIYNTATVQVISSRVMFEKMYDNVRLNGATLPGYPSASNRFYASGRLPFMVTADITVNSVKKRVRMVLLHSRSGSAAEDYDMRNYDIKVLHDSLNANYGNDNIIILGDFNDDVDTSIRSGFASTYKVFVDDAANFNALTYGISVAGGFTFPSSSSFLDHIIISNELNASYIDNSIQIEDPRTYITSYTTTTSDHLPITARFNLQKSPQAITFNTIADKTIGDAAFGLTASSNSGLAVSYSTTSDKVTIAGSLVTLVKAGRVSIRASQAGNESFTPATPVDQSFCIRPVKPIVTLSNPNTATPILTSNASAGNQWYLNGTPISGATNTTYNVSAPGIYTVQVRVDDCASPASSDIPVIITGDLINHHEVIAFPNPAIDFIEVKGITGDVMSSQIVNTFGQQGDIYLQKTGDVHRASIQNLSSGVYLLRVQDNTSVHQIKFIKK